MIRLTVFLMVSLVVLGCSEVEPPVDKLDQVILFDVQGLWGGTDLWVSADGTAVCRFAKPPEKGGSYLQETRYSFRLSEEDRRLLLDLVNKHNFFTIKTKDRYGVPDEARPGIFIKSGDKSHAVGKWSGDEHRDFDRIHRFLLEIAKSGRTGTQFGKGDYDWHWKPEGFPENKTIWNKTKPNLDKD